MKWLLNLRRLPARGVLGINRRNAGGIFERNARSLFPVVDDKLLMAQLCARIGVRSPTILGVITRHAELGVLERITRVRSNLVIKPARGSGGRGIMILAGRHGSDYAQANGSSIDSGGIRRHTADILAGMYSLGGRPDCAILQERVRPHPAFAPIAPRGIADIRIVLYRFEPAMAMLRLPTLSSNGRANLHQGGIGVGVDLTTGRTFHAVHRDRFIDRHPDTGQGLLDLTVPCWHDILEIGRRAARAVGLGFVGIDVVIDGVEGPMLLEANARPGLTIQLANNRGLLERIEEIDRVFDGVNHPR
jgi:alpha-L-glutamate ligase-like protein